MLRGFRDFVMRGNIVDLAVGFVIGVAFTGLVTAFTNAFVKPLIKLFAGGGVTGGTFEISGVVFDWGSFVNALITFLITATVLYFLVVMPMNRFRDRFMKPAPPGATEVDLLAEIRDELRVRR